MKPFGLSVQNRSWLFSPVSGRQPNRSRGMQNQRPKKLPKVLKTTISLEIQKRNHQTTRAVRRFRKKALRYALLLCVGAFGRARWAVKPLERYAKQHLLSAICRSKGLSKGRPTDQISKVKPLELSDRFCEKTRELTSKMTQTAREPFNFSKTRSCCMTILEKTQFRQDC